MADKETRLSIVIRTVDKATAAIRAIKERVAQLTGRLRDGFKRVGSAIGGVLSKVPLIGGAIAATAGVAVAGLMKMVDGFDELGDKAERVGVGVDFLAQMRYAAQRSGVAVEELDSGLQGFAKSLGEARAGAGAMASFLGKVSPALLRQLKATKSNEEAFDLLADAMVKVKDPAKRAALAQKVFGNAALAPLLARGSKGIRDLRDRYLELAGSQEEATSEAGKVDDAMADLKASTDGIKAALVTGLAPALKIVVDRLRDWFVANRSDIAEWAKNIGERLPGAIRGAVTWVERAVDKVSGLLEGIKALAEEVGRIRRKFLGPTVEERTEEMYARTAGYQKRVLAGASRETLLERAAQLRQEASNLYTKPGGYTEDDEVTIKLNEKLAADLEQMADARLFPEGPSLDMEKFKERYAAAAPDRFEKYDLQFVQPLVDALARSAQAASSQARVIVEFPNAPRGTRASIDPRSSADVNLKTGYQMEPAL